MKFNKKFLITVENPKAEALGVKAYRYKTCSVIDSREEYKGSMMHIVSLRTKDCRSNLSKEELYGILDALGMRRDGTMKMEETFSGHTVHFMQPLAS